MASPASVTINYDNVNSFTESKLIPELKDTITDAYPLIKMLDSKKLRETGGTFLKVPLMYAQGPFGFFDGRSGIDISEAEQFTNAIYRWTWAASSATISAADEAQNSGESATMSLLQQKYKSMLTTFMQGIGQGVHSAGTLPNEIVGLQSAIAGTLTTYGQISGTTYSWWRSVVRSMSSTSFSDTEADQWITDMTVDSDQPQALFCNRTVRGILYANVSPLQRIVSNGDANGSLGFKTFDIHGLPVYMDSQSVASTLYAINFDHLKLVVHSNWDMKFIPWDNWTSPFMKTCYVASSLQMVCSNRRFQGKMTSLTS